LGNRQHKLAPPLDTGNAEQAQPIAPLTDQAGDDVGGPVGEMHALLTSRFGIDYDDMAELATFQQPSMAHGVERSISAFAGIAALAAGVALAGAVVLSLAG